MKVTLNEKQAVAVAHIEGPLLILAGAGAGKTKTITERIVHIVKTGVSPRNILAITFTNKAAKEMKERVTSRLIEEGIIDSYSHYSEMPVLKTFHSFGVMVIRENAQKLGLNRHFTIQDSADTISTLKAIIVSEGLDPKEHEPAKYRNAISRYKGDFVSLEELKKSPSDHRIEILVRIWKKYEERLSKSNSLDFDDLLIKTVLLLKSDESVRTSYQNRFKYIHIDEYQDTNQVQYELCHILAEKHNNICVVGDGDQNIYSWRGANIRNILNFKKDYPKALHVTLEQNYRSTQTILNAANAIIVKNTIRADKNLFTEKGAGSLIGLVQNWDEKCEANFVALEIKKIMESGYDPREVAVLYRANFQSRILEEAMLRYDVGYQVLGVRFFERKEVKDIISYLRVALNRESLLDMKRALEMPKRGIGKVSMLKLFQGQGDQLTKTLQSKVSEFMQVLDSIKETAVTKSLSETISFIITASGIEKALATGSDEERERLENIRELVSLATKYDDMDSEDALEKFFEESSLVSDQDTDTEEKLKVRMMTVHASKGLEFGTVFVVGLEHDLFPHKKIGAGRKTQEEAEEERRLFYVAITRAKEKLYLSYAEIRTIFGSRQLNIPSIFISDIPEELLEEVPGGKRSDGSAIVYL